MINDIYSKEKEISKKDIKYDIQVDHRERRSLVPSVLTKNFNIEYKELKVADYIVKNVAIERKSLPDLISSLLDKHLFRQLKELKQYKNHLLIIEGDLKTQTNDLFEKKSRKKSLHPNALKGFILSILIKYKVPIIFTRNYSETAEYMLLIAKKQKKNMSTKPNKIFKTKREELIYVLESLSGIGPIKANQLLKKFKTLRNIFSASEKTLTSTIGKKGEKLFKIINLNYIP